MNLLGRRFALSILLVATAASLAAPSRAQTVVPNSGCNTCYSYVPACSAARIGQPFSVAYVYNPQCPACIAAIGQLMWTSISLSYAAVPLGGWSFTCSLMVPDAAVAGFFVTLPIPNNAALVGLVFYVQQVCVKASPYPPLFPSKAVAIAIET